MFDDAGKVMFTTLHDAAALHLGDAHPCTMALAAAADDPRRDLVAVAQTALAALPEADREALLAAAHRTLRSDPRAWLALWPGGPARH